MSTSTASRSRRIASFAACSVSGAWPASRSQSVAAAASRSSRATTCVTKPAAFASSASISSASSSMRFARPGPKPATTRAVLALDRQLPSVRAIGTPKRASGVAMRRSAAAASASPPPTTHPSQIATTGIGRRSSASTPASMRCSYATPSSAPAKAANCAMYVPATNALPPAPRSVTTRTSLALARRAQIAPSCSYIVHVNALCACGRSKTTDATAPEMSRRTAPSLVAGSLMPALWSVPRTIGLE